MTASLVQGYPQGDLMGLRFVAKLEHQPDVPGEPAEVVDRHTLDRAVADPGDELLVASTVVGETAVVTAAVGDDLGRGIRG